MCSKHLLEVWEAIFKYDEKGREKGGKARKVTERKKGQYAFIRSIHDYTSKGEE
jgi:hypothetical protein